MQYSPNYVLQYVWNYRNVCMYLHDTGIQPEFWVRSSTSILELVARKYSKSENFERLNELGTIIFTQAWLCYLKYAG